MNHVPSAAMQPNILIVDDAPDNLRLLAQLLEGESYQVRSAPSGKLALQRTQAQLPDLILLDIQMPEMGGFEVCRILKRDELTRDVPIIFLTAPISSDEESKGLELGAIDYITKPFSTQVVLARVRNHLQYVHQKRLLEQLAALDPLTEVCNRRGFGRAMLREWGRATRERTPLSLAFLDIDQFKEFNDTRGHYEGDKALQAVAKTLMENTRRPGDMVARYGGDEFVYLLPNTDSAGALAISEIILRRLATLEFDRCGPSATRRISATVGGVSTVPGVGQDRSQFLKSADANLYRAKEAGNNRVFWSSLDTTKSA